MPATPTYNDGVATVRIGRTTVSGDARRTVVTEEAKAPVETSVAVDTSIASAHAIATGPAPDVIRTPRLASLPAFAARAAADVAATTRPTGLTDDAGAGFARLAYIDEQGPHVFVIRKELVAIGRGGTAHWVDVQVVSTPRVSRVHCRIRRDASGRFFIQDVSTWGTYVDGERVPAFVRRSQDGLEETGDERELLPAARIQLADAVTLEFQVLTR